MAADDEPGADGVLRAEVGRRDGGLAPTRRRRTPLITMAAAVGVLVLGLAAAAWWLVDGEDAVQPTATSPTTADSLDAAVPGALSPGLPAEDVDCPGPAPIGPVPVDGFGSPEVLTTPHPGLDTVQPGQLVVGWTDVDGNVLLARWPGATGSDDSMVSCDVVQLTIESLAHGFGASQTYDPATTTVDDARDALLASFDADAAALGVPGHGDGEVDDTPRFNGSLDVEQLPSGADPCQGGEEDIPSDSGGRSSTPPAATAEDVVASFLSGRSATWDTSGGFTRLVDPGGAVVYGVPSPGSSDTYVALVWVAETPEGWIVDRWEVSGC